MVKIIQEKVTVMLECVSGIRRKKGVQKYHIHKGTARLNPEYERIKRVASEIEKFKKYKIEVEKVISHGG